MDKLGREIVNRKALLLLLLIALSLTVVRIPEARAQDPQGEPGGFGYIPPKANYTAFWSLFNKYSSWDLEANTGSGWFSVKQDLTIEKNYTDPETCKITLIFEASYSGDYRLTFGIDLRVKNYTYRESLTRYSLEYQNYTAFFDFSDLLEVPQLQFSHGVTEVDGKDVFWFRARRDNVPVGAYLELDPTFGFGGGVGWSSLWQYTDFLAGNYTSPDSEYNIIAYRMGIYLYSSLAQNVKFSIYKHSDLSFIGESREIPVQDGGVADTYYADFWPLLVLEPNTEYLLCVAADGSFKTFIENTPGVDNAWVCLVLYEADRPDPYVKDEVYELRTNIYCYYYEGYSETKSVSQSSDDVTTTAYNAYPIWWFDDVRIRAGESSSADHKWYDTGLRFQEVNVPGGANIIHAILMVWFDESIEDTVNTRIYAEATDDADTFSTRADFLSRSRTTSYGEWDSIEHFYIDGYADGRYGSSDFSSAVEEVTNRTGWDALNDMVIFWGDVAQRSSYGVDRTAYSWDYEDGSKSAAIQIIWQPGISIGEFEASASTVYDDEWFNVNCSLKDPEDIANIKNCTLALNGSVVLAWDNATATFSINQDPDSFCTLNSTACIEEETNSTAFTLSWRIKLSSSYPTGSIDVLSSSTEVYDTEGASGSGSSSGLFTFTLRDPDYQPGGTPGGRKRTPLEDFLPALIPTTVAPVEAQYGTIALVLIMGGAVIYYLRKPRGARELWKAQDRKAPKRSRRKEPKASKNSGKIKRNFKKKRGRNPDKW